MPRKITFEEVSSEYIEVYIDGIAVDVINIYDYKNGCTKADYNFIDECKYYFSTHTANDLLELAKWS